VLARALGEVGPPVWRHREANYASLARILAYQQISVKAAASIWARVEARLGVVDAPGVLALGEDDLRACGLSRPKVAHMRAIALAVVEGRLDFGRLLRAELGEARAELLAVRGIGPWTVEVFAMSALGARDAFPGSDIGLSEAWKRLAEAQERPDPKRMGQIAQAWAPWRAVAAHLLWHWLNTQRGRA
jgi:DNA-3-methyladenine glycosylase II